MRGSGSIIPMLERNHVSSRQANFRDCFMLGHYPDSEQHDRLGGLPLGMQSLAKKNLFARFMFARSME